MEAISDFWTAARAVITSSGASLGRISRAISWISSICFAISAVIIRRSQTGMSEYVLIKNTPFILFL